MERMRTAARSEDGFSLVELLVVMVVVGLLAAIATPAFLAQKRAGHEAAAKSDVQAIAREVATFYVGDSGPLALRPTTDPLRWELATVGDLVVASGKLSPGNSISASSAISSDSSYCVAVVPASSSAKAWRATQAGLAAGPCP